MLRIAAHHPARSTEAQDMLIDHRDAAEHGPDKTQMLTGPGVTKRLDQGCAAILIDGKKAYDRLLSLWWVNA